MLKIFKIVNRKIKHKGFNANQRHPAFEISGNNFIKRRKKKQQKSFSIKQGGFLRHRRHTSSPQVRSIAAVIVYFVRMRICFNPAKAA